MHYMHADLYGRTKEFLTSICQRQNPLPPLLPLGVGGSRLEALILDHSKVGDLLPGFVGARVAAGAVAAAEEPPGGAFRGARPSGFVHEAFDGLLFGPALLNGNVGEVSCAIAPAAVDERDADPVDAENPV